MKWIRIPATSTSVPTNAYQLAPRNAQTVLYASGEKIATMFIDMWKRIKEHEETTGNAHYQLLCQEKKLV